MAGKGGYQAPDQPAAVSGPGAMSQRTDGRQNTRDLPNAKYGEGKEFREVQQGAPMAEAPREPLNMPVPFGAPTQRPDESVMAGAPLGDGPGPEAVGIAPNIDKADYQNMKHLIPGLERIANMPQSNPSTRALVRFLKANAE